MYLKEAFEKANVGDEICRNGTNGFKKQGWESFGFFAERLSKMGWSMHGLLSDEWEVIPQKKKVWVNLYWDKINEKVLADPCPGCLVNQFKLIDIIEVEIP